MATTRYQRWGVCLPRGEPSRDSTFQGGVLGTSTPSPGSSLGPGIHTCASSTESQIPVPAKKSLCESLCLCAPHESGRVSGRLDLLSVHSKLAGQ